jgi:hypothetical protein
MRKITIDGHIILNTTNDRSIFFNSKFETANLNKVFKVNPEQQNKTKLKLQGASTPV